MNCMRLTLALAASTFALPLACSPAQSTEQLARAVEKPAALVADGIPEVPAELAAQTRPYMEFRTASFLGWQPAVDLEEGFGRTLESYREVGWVQ